MRRLRGLARRWVPGPPPVAAPELPDLTWVAEWIDNVRDYIHVREADSVFIQRPNKATKMNPQGIRMLGRLLDGDSIHQILAPWGGDAGVWADTERFLLDIRRHLKDGLPDTYESPAVAKEPFRMGFSRLPVLSEVAVTYRCNAACTFCYAGCNCTVNPVGNDREMSIDQIKTVLDKIAHQAQVPSVSFTGGEATLRPDLPEMIRHARSLGMRVNLITNGILSADPSRVEALADAGLHSAQVSIEGTTAEIHEAVTQIRGSFDKAVRAVRNYRAAGITVHTNTTILATNLRDVTGFPAFARQTLETDRFSMNLVIPTGSVPVREADQVVRYKDVAPVLVEILANARVLDVELMWYSPTPMCIFNPIVHGLGNKGCSACDGLISVGSDGQVIPCASYDEPLGSLLDRPFDEIWDGPLARHFREKGEAHDLCRSCDQFHICNGACPLYWRQIGYDELFEARGLPTPDASRRPADAPGTFSIGPGRSGAGR